MGIKTQIPDIPLTPADSERIKRYLAYSISVPTVAHNALHHEEFVPGNFAIVAAMGEFGPYLRASYPDLSKATGGEQVGDVVFFPITLRELDASIVETGFDPQDASPPDGFVLVVVLDEVGYTFVFTQLKEERVLN